MRVATYLRVRTRGQDVEPQRLRLRQACGARGWERGRAPVRCRRAPDRRPALDALCGLLTLRRRHRQLEPLA